MMNKVLEFMGKDHDRLDNIFEEFRTIKDTDMGKATTLFHDFKIGLQRHIIWEEKILFPIFEIKRGMHNTGPTAVMRMEHRQIKEFLEKIHDKIVKGEVSGISELENGLLEVMKPHSYKEESIIYPWIDNSASEEEREEAFTKMKNLPADVYNKCCE